MKKIASIITICSIAFIFFSCEREVNFNLGEATQKVVIEGGIENGSYPLVRLSKSIGFFSKIDLQTLSEAFLHDAEISVSDGTNTVYLKEYEIEFNNIKAYFYTIDTSHLPSLGFMGEIGKTYTLKVTYNNETYESVTSIPGLIPLDSLWAEEPTSFVPDSNMNQRILKAQYSDPDTFGNYARYFTSRNGEAFSAPYYSVFDDLIVNGTTVQIELTAGYNRMDSIDANTFGYFFKGDTVVVKWSSIDKGVFDFWRTLEFSSGSIGNPFATPVQITTNITNGALGVWAGYGVSYDTLIIDK